MEEAAEFWDASGRDVGVLGVFLGAFVTGAFWWNFASGPATWHPGVLGVIVTPLSLLGILLTGLRLARRRG